MPVRKKSVHGQTVYRSMRPVDIDEDTLQKIADMTGGKYYRADNAEQFQEIYAEIDKLEKSEADDQEIYAVHGNCFPGSFRRGWDWCWRKSCCGTPC